MPDRPTDWRRWQRADSRLGPGFSPRPLTRTYALAASDSILALSFLFDAIQLELTKTDTMSLSAGRPLLLSSSSHCLTPLHSTGGRRS